MSRAPRVIRYALYLLLAAVGVEIAYALAGSPGGELGALLVEDGIYNGVLVSAAAVCLARAALVREERTAWALIGAGLAAWSAADL